MAVRNARRTASDRQRVRGARSLGGGKLSARAIAAARKRAEAVQYRIQGYGFGQIAEALKVSLGRAYQLVDEALTETMREPAESLRQIEAERLDVMTAAIMPNAVQGDPASVGVVLKIMERRARLLGLDAPARTEMTGRDGKPLEMRVLDGDAARASLLAAIVAAGLAPTAQAASQPRNEGETP